MKKVWTEASIETMEISVTAGGPVFTAEVDSDTYFDEDQQKWYRYYGVDPDKSK